MSTKFQVAAVAFCMVAMLSIAQAQSTAGFEWPNATLTNQNGEKVAFRDLVKDRVVVIDTVFTTCNMICPLMGAQFAKLSMMLASTDARDVQLISITSDWKTDTYQSLHQWSERFGPSRNWTLLTGDSYEVNRVLKALQLYVPDKNAHSSRLILASTITGERIEVDGNISVEKIAELLLPMARRSAMVARASKYFGNDVLVDQDGHEFRFYDDLLKGKVVVINSFFATCNGSCPMMSRTFGAIQERLGNRLGRDVELISITVDPANDTPAVLKEYATRFHVRPGWHLLTGDPHLVNDVLTRLGEAVPNKEDHLSIFLIGNERTGLWKKAIGLSPPEEIMDVVESVLADGQ